MTLWAEPAYGGVACAEPLTRRTRCGTACGELSVGGQHVIAIELVRRETPSGIGNFLSESVRLLDEPLHHGEDGGVVETLDLVRLERDAALHELERAFDVLTNLDLLTNGRILEELDINVNARRCHAPGHAADDLVKRRERRDARTVVAGGNQQIDELIEARLCVRRRCGECHRLALFLAKHHSASAHRRRR
jgi:hypothetical protein